MAGQAPKRPGNIKDGQECGSMITLPLKRPGLNPDFLCIIVFFMSSGNSTIALALRTARIESRSWWGIIFCFRTTVKIIMPQSYGKPVCFGTIPER